jgi:hypothetical protein
MYISIWSGNSSTGGPVAVDFPNEASCRHFVETQVKPKLGSKLDWWFCMPKSKQE